MYYNVVYIEGNKIIKVLHHLRAALKSSNPARRLYPLMITQAHGNLLHSADCRSSIKLPWIPQGDLPPLKE